jgi:5-methylcytosine-specific restriction endonuclease McrA
VLTRRGAQVANLARSLVLKRAHRMDDWRAKYNKRISSPQWKNMKRDVAKMRGNKCERCESQFNLALHHKTYERLGKELLSDLELVCEGCHRKADVQRAAAGRAKSVNALHSAAMNTYATKKYGEDYESWVDPDRLAEEFEAWLERKEDDW